MKREPCKHCQAGDSSVPTEEERKALNAEMRAMDVEAAQYRKRETEILDRQMEINARYLHAIGQLEEPRGRILRDLRDIHYRKPDPLAQWAETLHRPAGEVAQVFAELEAEGLVVRDGKGWRLAEVPGS
jgi:predicted Rossmann fold nucleotide-binding protein DprA/Smf involved in DNA uptake